MLQNICGLIISSESGEAVRLLVINPNTSTFVTDTVVAEAERAAAKTTEIVGVTGTRGAPIIGCRTENAIGTYEAIELAATHSEGCDAVLLAVSFDSGLQALRELLPIPVVAMSEAAMLTACMLGSRFTMVTFGQRAVRVYEELVESYGLASRFAGVATLPQLTDAELRDPSTIVPGLIDAIDRAAEQHGADVAILAGAVFAGLTEKLHASVSIPVVDGIAAGVRMAEMLVASNFDKPRSGSYAPPARKKLIGVSPELAIFYDRLK